MSKCPFFGKCGGCKYDFTSPEYKSEKLKSLGNITPTHSPIWIDSGTRRRADFCFAPNQFGFFETRTKNIVNIDKCPNLTDEINQILPLMHKLPWCGSGSCLITQCDNGIDIAITSAVPYFTPEFRTAALKLPAIRITWNNQVIKYTQQPIVHFDDQAIEYPSNAFLQPSISGADKLRTLVQQHAAGHKKIADLFCGLGNFTFTLGADGFDIVGTGTKRDLFKHPLTVGMLKQYDCVVMDPPRAGAKKQCIELTHSDIKKVIYISCNPQTWQSDSQILTSNGYKLTTLIPVDQFAGSTHWELFSVFEK
jgi:23S rRNA (uracil1939-C5)-methyltransferase